MNSSPKNMERVYFNILEAERHLPALSTLIKRAQALKVRLEYAVKQQVTTIGEEELVYEELADISDLNKRELKEQFYETVGRIENYGVILKDVDEGLIDFYTKFEKRDVLLCWKLGERRIRYWHECDEDYDDRKKILEL